MKRILIQMPIKEFYDLALDKNPRMDTFLILEEFLIIKMMPESPTGGTLKTLIEQELDKITEILYWTI